MPGSDPDNKWQLIDERRALQDALASETSQEVHDYRRTAKLNRWFDCVHWPWVQTMRSYVQQASREQLAAEIGLGAAAIADIVPEIRRKLPDLETPPELEPGQARFRLFDSITTFLKNAA